MENNETNLQCLRISVLRKWLQLQIIRPRWPKEKYRINKNARRMPGMKMNLHKIGNEAAYLLASTTRNAGFSSTDESACCDC